MSARSTARLWSPSPPLPWMAAHGCKLVVGGGLRLRRLLSQRARALSIDSRGRAGDERPPCLRAWCPCPHQHQLHSNECRRAERLVDHNAIDNADALVTTAQPLPPPLPAMSVAVATTATAAAPKKPHYEWMGPPGATLIMTALPPLIYFLYYACTPAHCLSLDPSNKREFLSIVNPFDDSESEWFSAEVMAVYVGWVTLHALLYKLVPGPVVSGAPLDSTGARLQYPINGLLSGVISVSMVFAIVWTGVMPATYIADHFLSFCTSAIIFAFTMSVVVYGSSLAYDNRTSDQLLSSHGQTGNILYDFFVGRPLNPRMLGIDWKYMCELRPGLIGWLLVNGSMLAKQRELTGSATPSMWLVLLFQSLYVYDALVSEQAILTTMDITTDGFGFMLVFGDLAWVPFTYSLQARYLAYHPTHLSRLEFLAIVALNFVGFWIFRQSNNQKNEFRSGVKNEFTQSARFLQTERGTRLLTSGWWGVSRHANYMGDLIMALSWSLPTGFRTPVTYFYPIYFLVLLVHRERRDDAKCREKYGKDWDKYCQLVPYRIFPYIY